MCILVLKYSCRQATMGINIDDSTQRGQKRGGIMAATKLQIEQIKQAYEDGLTEQEICHLTRLSRNTIRKYKLNKLHKRSEQTEHFKQEYKRIKEIEHQRLIGMMKNDNRAAKIIDKMLDIMNDEKTLKKQDIRVLLTGYGILIDKAIKYEQLEVNRKQAKDGYTINIDNNVGAILKLMGEATEMHVDPATEIKEFKEESSND